MFWGVRCFGGCKVTETSVTWRLETVSRSVQIYSPQLEDVGRPISQRVELLASEWKWKHQLQLFRLLFRRRRRIRNRSTTGVLQGRLIPEEMLPQQPLIDGCQIIWTMTSWLSVQKAQHHLQSRLRKLKLTCTKI